LIRSTLNLEKIRDAPSGIAVRCPKCREVLYTRDWLKNLKVCYQCGDHARLSAKERVSQLLDVDSFVEMAEDVFPTDPLQFVYQEQGSGQLLPYTTKLREAQQKTGLTEAVIVGCGTIDGQPLVLAVMDFHFIGGSMGAAVGEKITRAIELACDCRLPLLIVTASGGARIQEGIFSLLQMTKTVAALARLREAALPFISLLTNPTMGGVTASFALLGDILLAEPGALIGFAGPRVIEGSMRQKLPADTDTAEFMLAHGMIDAVVPRQQLRVVLGRVLTLFGTGARNGQGQQVGNGQGQAVYASQVRQERVKPDVYWEHVLLARHRDRPYAMDYIKRLCENFLELCGDRHYGDDPALVGGLGMLDGRAVLFLGHQKGRNTKENTRCNFGMPHPEGYRKAERLMRLAEKFGFPVICLIDTPGAAPDLEAEQRGQSLAIAECLATLSTLRVPVIAVIIGEGGSGGALALGLADRVLMLEHAIYTVASPEAAALIVWRDSSRAAEAAATMRITAQDLLELGVIDGVIPEPAEGAHTDHASAASNIGHCVQDALVQLEMVDGDELVAMRCAKFRRLGCFT
jgi:acetyl-CoA carboxylase carboxyl transferase alpha subunit/acetyl-CoA carboxylase carboxyl transferase beta subunit